MSRVIAIVGSSGSGKTTLVNALVDSLSSDEPGELACTVIAVDDYYRDLSHLAFEAREAINFDHPDAIDMRLLADHLDQIRSGEAIEAPCYDFTQHTRLPHTQRISSAPIVFVEGVLAVADQAIRDRLDHVVFVDTPEDLCLERRIAVTRKLKPLPRVSDRLWKPVRDPCLRLLLRRLGAMLIC